MQKTRIDQLAIDAMEFYRNAMEARRDTLQPGVRMSLAIYMTEDYHTLLVQELASFGQESDPHNTFRDSLGDYIMGFPVYRVLPSRRESHPHPPVAFRVFQTTD